MLLVGVGMVSSLVTSVSIINAGASEAFLAGLPDAQRDTVAHQLDSLINAPAPLYLLGIGEGGSAAGGSSGRSSPTPSRTLGRPCIRAGR